MKGSDLKKKYLHDLFCSNLCFEVCDVKLLEFNTKRGGTYRNSLVVQIDTESAQIRRYDHLRY